MTNELGNYLFTVSNSGVLFSHGRLILPFKNTSPEHTQTHPTDGSTWMDKQQWTFGHYAH